MKAKGEMLSNAILIATKGHHGQLDKGGNPYILHPLTVMHKLKTDDEELQCIAILHDWIEDCKDASYQELLDIGMTERIISGIKALTKLPGETYEEYQAKVFVNKDAMLVKKEDLRTNSDLRRLKNKVLQQKDIDRIAKYMAFYLEIEQRLASIEVVISQKEDVSSEETETLIKEDLTSDPLYQLAIMDKLVYGDSWACGDVYLIRFLTPLNYYRLDVTLKGWKIYKDGYGGEIIKSNYPSYGVFPKEYHTWDEAITAAKKDIERYYNRLTSEEDLTKDCLYEFATANKREFEPDYACAGFIRIRLKHLLSHFWIDVTLEGWNIYRDGYGYTLPKSKYVARNTFPIKCLLWSEAVALTKKDIETYYGSCVWDCA